jgi:hypothetical protein
MYFVFISLEKDAEGCVRGDTHKNTIFSCDGDDGRVSVLCSVQLLREDGCNRMSFTSSDLSYFLEVMVFEYSRGFFVIHRDNDVFMSGAACRGNGEDIYIRLYTRKDIAVIFQAIGQTPQ